MVITHVSAHTMSGDQHDEYAQFVIADFLAHHAMPENNRWYHNQHCDCAEHCCDYRIEQALNLYDALQKIKFESIKD